MKILKSVQDDRIESLKRLPQAELVSAPKIKKALAIKQGLFSRCYFQLIFSSAHIPEVILTSLHQNQFWNYHSGKILS